MFGLWDCGDDSFHALEKFVDFTAVEIEEPAKKKTWIFDAVRVCFYTNSTYGCVDRVNSPCKSSIFINVRNLCSKLVYGNMTGIARCIVFFVLQTLSSENMCRGGACEFVCNRPPKLSKALIRKSENFNCVANSAMPCLDCVMPGVVFLRLKRW